MFQSRSQKEECAERTEYITADEEKLETSDEKLGEESKQTPKECDMQRLKISCQSRYPSGHRSDI